VIRTRAIRSPALNRTPANDWVAVPAAAGTANVPRLFVAASKNSMLVVLARSTSVKTAPKALTVAGVVVPGTKKKISTILLLTAVNSLCAENVENVDE
jgi:hypothetical protein